MDPITHAVSGMVIQQLGFRRKAALFVLVFSSMAPDLDYITRFWGTDVFLDYHRGITHGILALALFPLLMGAVFRTKGGFFYYYALSFLAYGVHLLLDLTTPYGTMILSPLDWTRYSLDLTFIIDPYISGGLLLAVILGRTNKKHSVAIAFAALLLISGYIGGRSYLQDQAKHFLKTKVDANIYRIYPLPNGFLRWWFVTRSGDEITTGFADLFMKKVFIYEKFREDRSDPDIVASQKSGTVRSFLAFAKNPHAEVKKEINSTTVIWKELSYSFLPNEGFSVRVKMDKHGKILESGVKL
ncbi:MAG: metal-dependent hydrolase [Deltaproteobacteria bacterium]|nr:metal-dependent hydrolase [Deltaproteobacteria bacterium]